MNSLPALALVGLGGYGQTHLRFIRACADQGLCRLVSAVVLPDTLTAHRTALPPGVRTYPDFESWLAAETGRFDLCCLPTPIHLHASMTTAALAAGGSVLVEKPLAACAPEVAALCAVQPAPGRFVAVGFQDLYLAETHALKAALLSGAHGRLRRIKVLGLWPRADAYYARNSWAGRLATAAGPALDSPLNNALAHWLMQALFLAGDAPLAAARVTGGTAELYRSHHIESFDTAALRLTTSTGVELVVAMTHSGVADETPRVIVETDRTLFDWHVWQSLHTTPRDAPTTITPLPTMDATRHRLFAQVCRRAAGQDVFVCPPSLAAAHSACIIDLHAAVPIHDATPAAFAEIDEALCLVFETGRLPFELNLPWARPPHRFGTHSSSRSAS